MTLQRDLRLGIETRRWDLGLESKIWAWRLGFWPGYEFQRRWTEEKKKEKEKFPLCVKA